MYARDAKKTGIQNEGKGTTLHTLQKALMNTSLLRLRGTTEALNKQTQMSPSFKLLDSLHFYIGRHSELEPSRQGFFPTCPQEQLSYLHAPGWVCRPTSYMTRMLILSVSLM